MTKDELIERMAGRIAFYRLLTLACLIGGFCFTIADHGEMAVLLSAIAFFPLVLSEYFEGVKTLIQASKSQ